MDILLNCVLFHTNSSVGLSDLLVRVPECKRCPRLANRSQLFIGEIDKFKRNFFPTVMVSLLAILASETLIMHLAFLNPVIYINVSETSIIISAFSF